MILDSTVWRDTDTVIYGTNINLPFIIGALKEVEKYSPKFFQDEHADKNLCATECPRARKRQYQCKMQQGDMYVQ